MRSLKTALVRPLLATACVLALTAASGVMVESANASSGPAAAAPAGTVASAPAGKAEAKAQIGQPAPDFTLTDLDGKTVRLSDFKGKTVVLEWFNPGCPFVKYAHGEGPLKDMAAKQTAKGVVWLSINSSAPGKQGHGAETNNAARKEWAIANPVLLDEGGQVGRQYEAKTTPHMYVIDAQGILRYRGALDNAPHGEQKGGEAPVNYVEAALTALAGGKPVAVTETKSYGCGVKYGG